MDIVHCMGNFLSVRPENQWWRQLEVRFYSRPCIIQRDQVGYSNGGKPSVTYYSLNPVVFKKYLILFGLSAFCLKNIFHLQKYTHADFKICQYLRLHLAIIYWRFQVKMFEATSVMLQPLEGRNYFIKIERHFCGNNFM